MTKDGVASKSESLTCRCRHETNLKAFTTDLDDREMKREDRKKEEKQKICSENLV